ncbi:MAG: hypothetical protein K2J99_04810, partial [Lachnospiraceae bacterium]|nr:hypothetical protein [Lachnospiraceae bacterium]
SDPYWQQAQSNPYGQPQSDPYWQQAQSNPYGQPQSDPYWQQAQNNPYGQQNDSYGSYQYSSTQPQGNQYGQQFQPYNPQGKKKGTAKIIIAVACVCVVVVAGVAGTLAYLRSTPAYKITKGFQNIGKEIAQVRNPMAEKLGSDDLLLMMEEDGYHMDTKLDFTIDLPMMGDTTLGIDTDFYKDMQAKELNADTSLSMFNYDFAHLNIYANDEVFCFSVPELFIEDMYVDNENVVSQFNDSILADFSSVSDAEEFSINLFPDKDERITMRDWKSFSTAFAQMESDLAACKDAMTLEKVEKGLYRVTFPQQEMNRLVKNYMKKYSEIYEMTGDLDFLDYYDGWITSDVSILFEISSGNRIESIMLEEPVKMLDGDAAVNGEIFFAGENRSIDKIQGKISVDGVDGETREIICQVVQDVTDDDYQVNMDIKYSDGYSDGKVKYVMNCDAVNDKFDMTFSVKDDIDSLAVALEGGWDGIVKGERVKFELDKLTFSMDDEELFKVSGDIEVEPIKDKIKPSVEPKTAFFEMTMSDWEDIIYALDDEYGSLLDALW